MRHRMPLFSLAAGCILLACNPVIFVTPTVPATPPMPPIVELSSGITPSSTLYRVGFLGFVDSTGGQAAPIAAVLSDQFMTFLTPIRRFEWVDAHRKRVDKPDPNVLPLTIRDGKNAEWFSGKPGDALSAFYLANYRTVDGVLAGSITAYKFSGGSGTVEVELRLVNTAYDHDNLEAPHRKELQNSVVLSIFHKVRFRMNVKQGIVTLEKSDVDKLARQIQNDFVGKFDELSADNKLMINEVNGRTFTFNAGSREQVKPGLVGYVVRVAGSDAYKYLAQFVVTTVEEGTSTAVVISPDNTLENVQPQSTVIIK
ncbi:hypothetical protein KKD52_14460 [Myxococcota bacterium]|nr:hypothetical protein [Myxococcota bacterium]MBU1511555.1 hypothetical protein [Myxococcota bacterium]